MKVCRLLVLLTASISGLFGLASAAAVEPRLHMDWPAGWEYKAPLVRGSITYLEARQLRQGSILQQLRMEVIHAAGTPRPVDLQALRELAGRLRTTASDGKTAVTDIFPLSNVGYYFSTQGGPSGVHVPHVEGVLVRDGYFLHFTLSTNDADTSEMLVALGSIRIR